MAQNWGNRTTWAQAGGSTPAIVCTDPFSLFTESDPVMGTGAVIDSSWQENGNDCSGHVRFKFGTTGMTPGEGFYIPTGWPRLPRMGQASADYARFIGFGTIIDASAGNRPTPIQLVLDYQVDATRPFFFCPAKWATVEDNAAASRTLLEANALPVVGHNSPQTFAASDVINITFAFEATTS